MKDTGSIKTNRNIKYYKDIEDRRKRLAKIKVKSLPNEKWVDIDEYFGHYKISNFFRIKSICRLAFKNNGSSVMKPEQLRAVHPNSDGYLIVRLTKERVANTKSLHILVAKAFIPNPENLPEVNHKDGNKLNCLPDNLEWGTHKYNMEHAVKNGLRKYGKSDSTKFKLTEQQVLDIFNSKDRSGILAKKYGLTKSSIQRIKSGKTYSKITIEGGGINSSYCRLSKEDALFIKNSSITLRKLAEMFNVSDTLVGQIKSGKSYKWINE